ncbi:hypothetical protein HZS_703 [Henneguya salminicola]|nr:hypothetical protein HZS_703 [Henneguya salminicola]
MIIKTVLPGTIIISNYLRSYENLRNSNLNHLTLNHSYTLIKRVHGARQIKWGLPETHTRQDQLFLYLGEYSCHKRI